MIYIGIWIDTNEANIVTIDQGSISVNSIFSGISRKLTIPGETSKKKGRGLIGFDYKSSQMNRFREAMIRFIKTVCSEISTASEVYILGPGDTKLLLENEIRRERLRVEIVKVEGCDNLTANQLVEQVRNFYASRKKVKPVKRKLPRRK